MLLIIDRKHTTLNYHAGALIVRIEGERPRSYAITMLDQVVIYGNTLIDAGALRALAAASVPTLMLSSRSNQSSACVGAGISTQLPLRRAQHRTADNHEHSLALAATLVRWKIQSYTVALSLLVTRVNADDAQLFRDRCASAIESTYSASDRASLMGIEGALAQSWFVLVARAIPLPFNFAGRNRQPPRDPLNAMLSLGYTLLNGEVQRAIQMAGMDPALGYLHAPYPGRLSLILDLLEPVRSGVDYLALSLVFSNIVEPSDFSYSETTGCRLLKSARGKYFGAWANQRQYWPRPAQSNNQDLTFATLGEITNALVQDLATEIRQRATETEPVDNLHTIEFDDDE